MGSRSGFTVAIRRIHFYLESCRNGSGFAQVLKAEAYRRFEDSIYRHLVWHMGAHSAITCRDVFAHGEMHSLHHVQLLQKLRTARRDV
jgi:hypothetical protein